MPPSPPAFHPRHLEKGAPRWRLPSLRRTSLRQCLAGALKQRAELQCFAMLRSQARQRAVLLYLCTFNFETHRAVPLLRRNQIYDVQNVYEILRLWELYGLDWPHRSKANTVIKSLKSKEALKSTRSQE